MKNQLAGGVLAKLPELLGTNQTSANTAVSAAVPMLLAALGSTASSRDGARNVQSTLDSFDARALDNNAMSSGLSSALEGVQGMGGVADWARGTVGSAYQAGRASVSEAAGTARASAATGASALRWVLPVLAVVIVAGLLRWWIGSMRTPQQIATVPQTAALTGQVNDFFSSATSTFAGIKDTTSAEAAVPKLRELSTRLDSMRAAMDQLPADARARLVALVKDFSAKLTPTMDSVMAMPAVGDTIKPLIDELRRKLNGMVTV